MTTIELLDALNAALRKTGSPGRDMEVEVWLPGSTIRLNGPVALRGGRLFLEGNVNPGSALTHEPPELCRYCGCSFVPASIRGWRPGPCDGANDACKNKLALAAQKPLEQVR